MEVILKKDHPTLGSEGAVVKVKNGFGRNYLIPQGYALQATAANKKQHEDYLKQVAHKLDKVKDDAAELGKRLQALEIVIPARVGEENRIFGTVTNQDVADFLAGKGLEMDRRKIELTEEIKSLGVFPANIKLHADVTVEVKVQVVPMDD